MNNLIRILYEQGWSKFVYDVFFYMSLLTVLWGLTWNGKRMGVPLKKTLLTILILYPFMFLVLFTLFWVESGFTRWGGSNMVRIYVYMPLAAIPVAKLLKMELKKMLAMLSSGILLAYAIGHIGCIFEGCCCGYVCKFGIYNPSNQDIRFPSPILEVLCTVAVIVYLFRRAKNRNYVPDGREYPVMMVLYGTSRFLCEFLRDNKKLVLGISGLGFHALFMVVVGIIWIEIMKRKENAIS